MDDLIVPIGTSVPRNTTPLALLTPRNTTGPSVVTHCSSCELSDLCLPKDPVTQERNDILDAFIDIQEEFCSIASRFADPDESLQRKSAHITQARVGPSASV